MWNWGYGAWWMVLVMVLFWAGVVALVIWAVRSAGPPAGDNRPDDRRAVHMLEERYARGEIDEEEFERRLRMLDRSRS
jgi:putative membrane protein